MIIENKF